MKSECRKCGVCCIALSQYSEYCPVTEEEFKALGRWGKVHVKPFSSIDRFLNGGWYGAIKTRRVTMKNGPLKGYELMVCDALQGDILHNCLCKIYKKRPHICREIVGAKIQERKNQ
jgi:Fe-S-cluster containining protein